MYFFKSCIILYLVFKLYVVWPFPLATSNYNCLEAFGKADLQIYKEAGDQVVELLARRCDATEKRSVDEVAIDISSEADRLLSPGSICHEG